MDTETSGNASEKVIGNKLSIPIAIIIAGALIAGAIYLVNRDVSPRSGTGNPAAETDAEIDLAPVTANDHILGNPDAKIVIVEFSDTECPFCKQFHETMHRIIDEYGRDGRVAWVYRHFPIPQLHSKAPKQAEATECAAELGGNTVFWKYIDRVFEITPSNNGLDMALLPVIAEEVGLDRTAFETCLNSGKHTGAVAAQFDAAIAAGASGTPYSIMIVDGELIPIPGAQPYATVRSAIEAALTQ
ncbi:MAG TPA: thioredoxin domain-containing protein [Candidatus Paceibacterota bacterium]|jgi:protein-disulfide isomerase